MEYVTLGKTGLRVSRMCLGTMLRSGPDAGRDAIEKAYELGCNFLDTANVYHDGGAEEIVGDAIKGRRDRFVVTTKVGMQEGDDPNKAGMSRKTVFREIEGSLRRLQTDYVDLYLCHQPDPATPIEETLGAMHDLVRQGKVRYVGVSNFAAWQVCEAMWTLDRLGAGQVACDQVLYSLFDRRIEDGLVPLCRARGVGITAYCTTFIGLLSGRYRYGRPKPEGGSWDRAVYRYDACLTPETDRVIQALVEIADQHAKTPSQVAMAWCLSHPEITSVITGADSPERVASNFEALDLELTHDQRERLNTVSAGMRMTPRDGPL